jgi:hypothetical protein
MGASCVVVGGVIGATGAIGATLLRHPRPPQPLHGFVAWSGFFEPVIVSP